MEKEYLSSKEVKSILKISGCHLMHARELGELDYIKKGRAFYYCAEDVEKMLEKRK